jgi:hypothetical protein
LLIAACGPDKKTIARFDQMPLGLAADDDRAYVITAQDGLFSVTPSGDEKQLATADLVAGEGVGSDPLGGGTPCCFVLSAGGAVVTVIGTDVAYFDKVSGQEQIVSLATFGTKTIDAAADGADVVVLLDTGVFRISDQVVTPILQTTQPLSGVVAGTAGVFVLEPPSDPLSVGVASIARVSGGALQTLVASELGKVILDQNDLIYLAAEGNDIALHRFDLTTMTEVHLASLGVGFDGSLAVDSSNVYLGYVDVVSVPRAGGSAQTLFKDVEPSHLAAGGARLYFLGPVVPGCGQGDGFPTCPTMPLGLFMHSID